MRKFQSISVYMFFSLVTLLSTCKATPTSTSHRSNPLGSERGQESTESFDLTRSSRFIVISPSVAQADYFVMHGDSFADGWKNLAPTFDAINLHGYNLVSGGSDSLGEVRIAGIVEHMKKNGKKIIIEMQSTTGLVVQYGSTDLSKLPEVCRNPDTSFSCGELSALHAVEKMINSVRKFDGSIVQALLLDSTFYDAYFQLGYWQVGGQHSSRARDVTYRFIDGFTKKAKEFVPGLEFIYLSHFKYEYVAGKAGLSRPGTTSNTARNGIHWTNEETTLEWVWTNLPGRFSRVFFDASWSSFYQTPDGWRRFDVMLEKAKDLKARVGMIIHTDNDLHDPFEAWFHENWPRNNTSPRASSGPKASGNCDVAKNSRWTVHTNSYIGTIKTGSNLIKNFGVIQDAMVASWHKFPYSTFLLDYVPVYREQACAGASLSSALKVLSAP